MPPNRHVEQNFYLNSYQLKQAQEELTQLKSGIVSRLGDLGEEIFAQAHTLFENITLSTIALKAMQRYLELSQKTQLFL